METNTKDINDCNLQELLKLDLDKLDAECIKELDELRASHNTVKIIDEKIYTLSVATQIGEANSRSYLIRVANNIVTKYKNYTLKFSPQQKIEFDHLISLVEKYAYDDTIEPYLDTYNTIGPYLDTLGARYSRNGNPDYIMLATQYGDDDDSPTVYFLSKESAYLPENYDFAGGFSLINVKTGKKCKVVSKIEIIE